jgi:hypothetical protein
VLVFFCTAFALFGNDLAVVYGDKESDKYVTPVTLFNIAVFTLEVRGPPALCHSTMRAELSESIASPVRR